jgi:hypothetical protein
MKGAYIMYSYVNFKLIWLCKKIFLFTINGHMSIVQWALEHMCFAGLHVQTLVEANNIVLLN